MQTEQNQPPSQKIALTTAEKSRLYREMWLLPLIFITLLISSFWLLLDWSEKKLKEENRISNEKIQSLTSIKRKLERVSLEEQEIFYKSGLFEKWSERKVIAPLNELDIQELLYTQAKVHGISEFEYVSDEDGRRNTSLDATLKRSTNKKSKETDEDELANNVSVKTTTLPQTLKLKIQHEKQMFDFLESITYLPELLKEKKDISAPPALAKLNQCSIERINPKQPLSPTKVNFSAICSIQWINILRTP